MGWPAVSAPPKAGSAPPPQAPNPPNQVQIWHCTNFSSCEAGPNPPPPPLKLQLHDLKKRRVLTVDVLKQATCALKQKSPGLDDILRLGGNKEQLVTQLEQWLE